MSILNIAKQSGSTDMAHTMPLEEIDAEAIAAVAKALAHPARVSIIRFLLSRPGCIGGDIVEEVGLAQSTVSEHLRILKASGLVVGTIERPRICYSLDPLVLAPLHVLIGLIEAREPSTDNPPCCYTPEGCIPQNVDARESAPNTHFSS